MKLADMIPIQEGIYELEKGRGGRSFREGDTIVLRFGSIETDFTPKKIVEDAEIFLPHSLQDQSLETIRVTSDGSYTDEDGKEQKLTSAHMEVIVKMTTGQRLMIVNAKDDGSLGQNKGDEPKTGYLSIIKLLDVLPMNLPDNTHGTDTASATSSEIIEGSSSPIVAPEDSTYGEIESDTTSIKSSIVAYNFENGRRYHAYQAGSYFLPNDEQEQDRLDMQYHVLRLAFDNNLFFAPIEINAPVILDLGTGTGIWAIDVADQFSSAEVTGTDLSPIQPTWTPNNVKFEVDDVELPWTFPSPFDLIHTRIMNGSIRDWPRLFRQSFNHCKPGGWMECQEMSVEARSDDGSLPENSYIREWCTNQEAAVQKLGLTLKVSGEFFKKQMTEAGFKNIVVREFKLPVGDWPGDPGLRNVGRYQLAAMLDGIHGLTIALWTRLLGWTTQEVEVFLAMVRPEFNSRHIHCYWPLYVVYGQKTRNTTDQ